MAGGGIGGGGATVAGYKGGGEEGTDGGSRKFWATSIMPAPGFSFSEPGVLGIILAEIAPTAQGISDTINRTMTAKFLFITPSFSTIRLRG